MPFSDAAKQARSNIGAIHQAGEAGTKVINGKVYHVIYRGGSDDAYDVDTSQPATPMPGASEPTSIATSTDQPNIVQRNPDGSVASIPNPNYMAVDPAQRSAQLAQMASSKITELQGKIGTGGYTQDQAQQDYDQWWDSTIEPAKAEIQQAQQQKQIDTQLKLSAEQRAQARARARRLQHRTAGWPERRRGLQGPVAEHGGAGFRQGVQSVGRRVDDRASRPRASTGAVR